MKSTITYLLRGIQKIPDSLVPYPRCVYGCRKIEVPNCSTRCTWMKIFLIVSHSTPQSQHGQDRQYLAFKRFANFFIHLNYQTTSHNRGSHWSGFSTTSIRVLFVYSWLVGKIWSRFIQIGLVHTRRWMLIKQPHSKRTEKIGVPSYGEHNCFEWLVSRRRYFCLYGQLIRIPVAMK